MRLILPLIALIWLSGCGASDANILSPANGWTFSDPSHFTKAIVDDYKGYIRALPPEVNTFVNDYSSQFYANTNGQHAVRIEIPLNGVWVEHVLIYDKNDKRIKTIKYNDGTYSS